jgi:hypothetical protein
VQQKNIGSLITPEIADNVGNRTAVVALIQVLEIEMQNRIANSHNHLAEQKHMEQEGIQCMPSSDVNQMFGWDVLNLREVLIEEKKKLQAKYWEDDDNEEIIRVNNETEFLGEMSMYATESIMSDNYQNFYYDDYLRAYNRGRLTLIRPEYCGFGLQLMTKLSSLFDQIKLKNEIGVMKKAKKAILEDEKLLKLFRSSCKENEHLEKEDDMKKMYTTGW